MKKIIEVSTTLNLREKPAKNAKILDRLANGLIVDVNSGTKVGWTNVTVNGKTGWVASEYLKDVPVVSKTVAPEPIWLKQARQYIGLAEVPGSKHNPTVVSWWSKIGTAFRDDETPWCAGFVGGVFEEVGIKSSRSAAARSYMKWGSRLEKPAVGAVVVYARGNNGWSGHVGFVVGKDKNGNIMTLGGNQGNKVSIVPFGTNRVLGYYWPMGSALPTDYNLPVLNSNGKVSTDEA